MLLLLVNGLLLSNSIFCFVEREIWIQLDEFGQCDVPNADDESITNQFRCHLTIVAVLGYSIQFYYVLFGSFSF